MNKIEPTYVTYEQAKLLKKIGFDIITDTRFFFNSELTTKTQSQSSKPTIYAPEQWQVIEWLRVKHGINVEARTQITSKPCKKEYIAYIDCVDINYNKRYLTPQEAYSAAFDYILTNMFN